MTDLDYIWADIKQRFGETFTLDFVRAQVAKLRNVGTEFDTVYNRLNSYRDITAQDPVANRRYYTLLTSGDRVRSQIRKAVASVQSVANWVKENLGVGLNDLQALPLIPIAIAGGIVLAVSAAVSWMSEAKQEMARLEAVKQAIAAADPEDRPALTRALLAKQAIPTVTGNLSSLAMWLAIGAMAIFVLPKILGRK